MSRTIFTDREDNRLGITRMVSSRGGVPAVYPEGKGPEVLLLDLEGESPAGKAVTVVLSAVKSPNLEVEGYAPGVLTGIIRFGNGSGKSELEFDIPCAETHDQAQGGATNGMSFTVPAGNFRLYARDDSLIIPKAGQGNPSNVGGSLVTGFVTHGRLTSAGTSILRKTDFFAWTPGLPAGETSSRFIVPPFAATYIIMRSPRKELTIRIGTNHVTGDVVLETYTIPDGEKHSARIVPPRATWIEVVNEDAADDVVTGQIIYNMDFQYPGTSTGFALLGISPEGPDFGPGGWLFRSDKPNSYAQGPLILTFNAPVDPATLSTAFYTDLGMANPPPAWAGPETLRIGHDYAGSSIPISAAVVGNTIEITNSSTDSRWGTGTTDVPLRSPSFVGEEVFIQLTAGLQDMDGNPLSNPGNSAYWKFYFDD